jgi:hypothetical protein
VRAVCGHVRATEAMARARKKVADDVVLGTSWRVAMVWVAGWSKGLEHRCAYTGGPPSEL